MGLRVALVVLTLLLSASGAAAQDVAADALLEQGLALRERGEHARALVYFQRAYEITPSPRALAQIALANQALHQWLVAYRKLTEALTHTNDPWIRTRRQALETALTSAQAHVGFVVVTGGVPGSHIWINGEEAGTAPLPGRTAVEPGLVRVEMRSDDASLMSRELPVEAATTAEVALPTEIVAPAPEIAADTQEADVAAQTQAAEPEVDRPMNTLRIVGWSSAAIGVAGLAAGVAFQLMRARAVNSANECADQLADRTGCSPSEWATRSENVDPYGTMSTIGYIAGGALVVAGVAMVILGGDDSSSSDVGLACGPSLNGIGALCAGQF